MRPLKARVLQGLKLFCFFSSPSPISQWTRWCWAWSFRRPMLGFLGGWRRGYFLFLNAFIFMRSPLFRNSFFMRGRTRRFLNRMLQNFPLIYSIDVMLEDLFPLERIESPSLSGATPLVEDSVLASPFLNSKGDSPRLYFLWRLMVSFFRWCFRYSL